MPDIFVIESPPPDVVVVSKNSQFSVIIGAQSQPTVLTEARTKDRVSSVVNSDLKIVIDEEIVAYSDRFDSIGETIIFRAEANAGSLDDQPAWRIRRITDLGGGDSRTEWAGGNANFDKVWEDRLSYAYI